MCYCIGGLTGKQLLQYFPITNMVTLNINVVALYARASAQVGYLRIWSLQTSVWNNGQPWPAVLSALFTRPFQAISIFLIFFITKFAAGVLDSGFFICCDSKGVSWETVRSWRNLFTHLWLSLEFIPHRVGQALPEKSYGGRYKALLINNISISTFSKVLDCVQQLSSGWELRLVLQCNWSP